MPGIFHESIEKQNNPARGWYQIYTFHIEKEPDFEELKWCLREDETIVLFLADIGAYRDKLLDDVALRRIADLFRFFETYKKDIIFRPVYDRFGNGMEREPDDFGLVTEHMEQLGKLINEQGKAVFLVQGLLLGSWGEMHHSKFLGDKKIRILAGILEKYLAKEQFLAVRTPYYWRRLNDKYEKNLKIGLFDDAILGSDTHMGTFAEVENDTQNWTEAWSRQKELSFEKELCRIVPNGGEAVQNESGQRKGVKEQIALFETMHLTYLNCIHDEKILNDWKIQKFENGIWEGKTVYDYIGSHLGYRFLVKEAKITANTKDTSTCNLDIIVENIGFANIYHETEIIVEALYQQESYRWIADTDARKWNTKKSVNISLNLPVQEQDIYLLCRRKKDGRKIYFANENADDRLYIGHLHMRKKN